jgi:hypothetical protein
MGGDGTDSPAHPVNLSDYWVFSTLVTNQQYTLCVQVEKCTPPDPTDNPGYGNIQNANDPVTGVTYDQAANYCTFVGGRLPTEAEWEKAAAGAPDMLGNASEWVFDWYDPNYYQNSPSDDPSGPENGTAHVVRSGSNSTTSRNSEDPQAHRSDLGFRCVVEAPEQFAPVCEAPLVYDNGTTSSTCPTLELVQVKNCTKQFPFTNVTVSGSPDVKIDSQGCIATDDPKMVSCQPPTSAVSAQANCQIDVSGESKCPAGYSLQGNTCIAQGAQGVCPAGLEFDSSKLCCNLPSSMPLNVAVCPVGTYYVASQNACLSEPVQELVTVSVEVEFKSCTARPGGESGGSCEPQSCGMGEWSCDHNCCWVKDEEYPEGGWCF